jgi:uncharacterized protein (TIGR02598 family)
MKIPIQGRKNAGFSLVEVALAVAIAALALITLLGLLPQGLEMSKKTAQLATNNSILEQVIRNLENLKWSGLPAQGNQLYKYYSDEGIEVASDSNQMSYVVLIDFSQIASLPQSDTNQSNLRRVVIKVASSSSPSFQFPTTNTNPSVAVFNYLIAKSR